MANLELLPSGSYRYKKQIDGKKYTCTFDHEPSDFEIARFLSQVVERVPKNAFKKCCENYINVKTPVLSPSTIRVYNVLVKNISDDFLKTDINDIDQVMIQNEIGRYSLDHSAKSTHNLHGFISAVLGMYRPNLHLHTTLPQKVKYEPYTPSEKDIKKLLDVSVGSPYHICIQLGILGMRRSEICGLQDGDLDGNKLSISKAMVKSDDGWVIKHITKTTEGKRVIYVPDALVEEIRRDGFYNGAPGTITHYIRGIQEKHGLPRFRFHDLRGFYASYAHSMGIPDAVIMESGGWKSDYVMKSVYRRALEDDKTKYQKQIASQLLSTAPIKTPMKSAKAHK